MADLILFFNIFAVILLILCQLELTIPEITITHDKKITCWIALVFLVFPTFSQQHNWQPKKIKYCPNGQLILTQTLHFLNIQGHR